MKYLGIVLAVGLVIALVGVGSFAASYYHVGPGESVVVTDSCNGTVTVQDHIGYWQKNIVPFCAGTSTFNTLSQLHVTTLEGSSRDSQNVYADLSVRYHINPTAVNDIYQHNAKSQDALNALIDPVVQQAGKAAIVNYALNDVTPNREAIRADAEQRIQDRLGVLHLVIEDVSLTNIHFDPQVEAGITATAAAHQEVLRANQTLQQAQLQAQSQLVLANASAQSIRMQADAVNAAVNATNGNNGFVEYTKWSRWNGQLPYSEGGGAVVGPFPQPTAPPPAQTGLNLLINPAGVNTAGVSTSTQSTGAGAPQQSSHNPAQAPGFEVVALLAAIGVAVVVLRRR